MSSSNHHSVNPKALIGPKEQIIQAKKKDLEMRIHEIADLSQRITYEEVAMSRSISLMETDIDNDDCDEQTFRVFRKSFNHAVDSLFTLRKKREMGFMFLKHEHDLDIGPLTTWWEETRVELMNPTEDDVPNLGLSEIDPTFFSVHTGECVDRRIPMEEFVRESKKRDREAEVDTQSKKPKLKPLNLEIGGVKTRYGTIPLDKN